MPAKETVLYATVAAMGAAGLYLLFKPSSGSKAPSLSRAAAMAVLKELADKLDSSAVEFATIFKSIRVQLTGHLPESDIDEYLRNSDFKELFDSYAQKIYDKHGVSESQFRSALAAYSDDSEMEAIQEEMRDTYEKALRGIVPAMKKNAPSPALTSEETLEVVTAVMDRVEAALPNLGSELRSMPPELINIRLESVRQEAVKSLLADKGIAAEDATSKFSYAISYHTRDPAFARKLFARNEAHIAKIGAISSGNVAVASFGAEEDEEQMDEDPLIEEMLQAQMEAHLARHMAGRQDDDGEDDANRHHGPMIEEIEADEPPSSPSGSATVSPSATSVTVLDAPAPASDSDREAAAAVADSIEVTTAEFAAAATQPATSS